MSSTMKGLVERLRQGVDPENIADTEKAMDQAASRIEYLESVAGAVSQGDLTEASMLDAMRKAGGRITRKEPAHHDYDELPKLKPEGTPIPYKAYD